jgi:hypothetical protein
MLKDSLLVNILFLIYNFFENKFSNGVVYNDISQLKSYKTSDTLVILGAGTSINELSEEQIEELNTYDVAGLSYSCLLPITQTFYFYEHRSWSADKLISLALDRSRQGWLQNLLWKNCESKSFGFDAELSQFLRINVCSILTDELRVIHKVIKSAEKFGMGKFFLLQKRGSVTALVHFAALLKYRKVMFVGVDLSSSKYFFENNEKYLTHDLPNPYSIEGWYDGSTHLTNDPNYGVPIEEVLRIYFECNQKIQFFVSSKSSALAKYLPVWQWIDSQNAN